MNLLPSKPERLLELKTGTRNVYQTSDHDDKGRGERNKFDILYITCFARIKRMFRAFHPEITAEILKEICIPQRSTRVVSSFKVQASTNGLLSR